MPRVGYDSSDNGAYVKLELSQPITEKTMVDIELPQYSKVGFKPVYKISHNERNFRVSYFNGWVKMMTIGIENKIPGASIIKIIIL